MHLAPATIYYVVHRIMPTKKLLPSSAKAVYHIYYARRPCFINYYDGTLTIKTLL